MGNSFHSSRLYGFFCELRRRKVWRVAKDAFDGPILVVSRARINMMCGDFDTALALLERSLQTPSGITIHELRLDPSGTRSDAIRVFSRC